MMATRSTQSTVAMDGTQRHLGPMARIAIAALVAVTVLVGVIGSTSVADALVRMSAVGAGIGIVAMCGAGSYLVYRALLDGAARQFGHAWRQRTR